MPLTRWNPLTLWRDKRARQARIAEIHGEIVAAARAPEIYAVLGVPDDLDGRFEVVVLHTGLVLRRLGELGESARPWAQEIVDRVFVGFEDALRELSISDVGVAKRVKSMTGAFFGRTAVYHAALDAENRHTLAAALARNVYRNQATAESAGPRLLADRIFAIAASLEDVSLDDFTKGRFRFPFSQGVTHLTQGATR